MDATYGIALGQVMSDFSNSLLYKFDKKILSLIRMIHAAEATAEMELATRGNLLCFV
jgi:hypothetical protein